LAAILFAVFILHANAELWCPFGGVEAMYGYFFENEMPCSLAISNFIILAGVLVLTLMFKRVFCGYMCPLGTIGELLNDLAVKLRLPVIKLPRRVEKAMGLFRYVSLAFILWITIKAGDLLFREFDPCYALISRHGKDITIMAYIVSGALIVFSLFFRLPLCRWLCPFAPVMNLFARFSFFKVRINPESCISCGRCSKVCPARIDVLKAQTVNSGECYGCTDCIEVCPVRQPVSAIGMSGGKKRVAVTSKGIVVACAVVVSVCFAIGFFQPLPPFSFVSGELPENFETLQFYVRGVGCRGSARHIKELIFNPDGTGMTGNGRLRIWTSSGEAKVIIDYDPAVDDKEIIYSAITTPYYEERLGEWTNSPFTIVK
jgi:Pyruvate/2-oxoacid:ferredoxin oxidoreductase delta subunit